MKHDKVDSIMKTILSIMALLLSIFYGSAQRDYDHQWIFGAGQGEEMKYGINLLDFHNRVVELSYFSESVKPTYRLSISGSFLCDMDGYINLQTNHCAFYDTAWNRISGEDLLTDTGGGALSCTLNGLEFDYASHQSSLLIPDLMDDSMNYLLHKDLFILDGDNHSENLWLSSVKENGDGEFDFKKKYTINEKHLVANNLTAIPNEDMNAWWVLMQRHNQNTFEKYLIANDTIISRDTQSIGVAEIYEDIGAGLALFSPAGRFYVRNSIIQGILLYEFNNETGELSNFRSIPYPNSDDASTGVCFSPNERFIYVSTRENFYQIDLENEDEVYHVGNFASFDEDGSPVGLGMMFSGPDCRIYVSPATGTYYMHVIHSPNLKGDDCNFQERALYLPARIASHLPNMPQYRYLNGCDSTILFPDALTSISDAERPDRITMDLFPNPSSELINLNYPHLDEELVLYLYSSLGEILSSLTLAKGTTRAQMDLSSYSSGIYWLQDGKGRIEVMKLVKE